MTAGQRSRVEQVIQVLDLIAGSADNLSCLDSCEAIDKRRVAIREAAIRARRELEVGFRLLWLPDFAGPRRRDGAPIRRHRRVKNRIKT
jgi:hypothetical protein